MSTYFHALIAVGCSLGFAKDDIANIVLNFIYLFIYFYGLAAPNFMISFSYALKKREKKVFFFFWPHDPLLSDTV